MLEEVTKAVRSGEPFEIHMADGKVYPVPHTDFIALSPKGFSVTVYEEDGYSTKLSVRQMTAVRSIDVELMAKAES